MLKIKNKKKSRLLGASRFGWGLVRFRNITGFVNLNLKMLSSFVFLSQGLASNAVIAKVNGELWDLDRPLEGDCTLELLMFDNEEAQAVRKHCKHLLF